MDINPYPIVATGTCAGGLAYIIASVIIFLVSHNLKRFLMSLFLGGLFTLACIITMLLYALLHRDSILDRNRQINMSLWVGWMVYFIATMITNMIIEDGRWPLQSFSLAFLFSITTATVAFICVFIIKVVRKYFTSVEPHLQEMMPPTSI